MPLLAYVAIILVSLGGILFELNWLTSPKLDSKPAVQASTTAAPPKVADAAIVPRSEAAPPRNVAPTVTLVPAATASATATAPAAVSAAAPEPALQPAAAPAQQAGTAPALSPAPFGVANANNTASPSESTAAASMDFKREFTNETKAVGAKVETKTDGTASAATFTPAVANSATPAVATSTNNKCDIAACSTAYQSFRAADCTYQPIDGTPRKVCDRAPETAQRAAMPEAAQRASVPGASAPVRDPRQDLKHEAATRKAGKDAELRAVEREVRRMTASEAALDPGQHRVDRSLDRNLLDRGGRSEVIMIERPNRDW